MIQKNLTENFDQPDNDCGPAWIKLQTWLVKDFHHVIIQWWSTCLEINFYFTIVEGMFLPLLMKICNIGKFRKKWRKSLFNRRHAHTAYNPRKLFDLWMNKKPFFVTSIFQLNFGLPWDLSCAHLNKTMLNWVLFVVVSLKDSDVIFVLPLSMENAMATLPIVIILRLKLSNFRLQLLLPVSSIFFDCFRYSAISSKDFSTLTLSSLRIQLRLKNKL